MTSAKLQPEQHAFVEHMLPGYHIVTDLSWHITDTIVLLVEQAGTQHVVKAFGPNNHHFEREHDALTTHAPALGAFTGQLRAASTTARVLVMGFLPGVLVQGSPAELESTTYEKAGALLRTFHDQAAKPSAPYEAKEVQGGLTWLAKPHRIPPAIAAAATQYLEAYEPSDGFAVPTHGDYQPRNWLIDDHGVVRMIDFGRFAWRAPESDFGFLHTRQWRTYPECEAAFFRGYGTDPRATYPERWKMHIVRFAVGAAAWGYSFGQHKMEEEGLELLTSIFAAEVRS